jgi:tripartite-type tricarboxylate transporter receptor subunit TctC
MVGGRVSGSDTPADRIAALNAAINTATNELARSGALTALGIEPVTETAAQFKAYIANDVKEGAELLKDAGFKPE